MPIKKIIERLVGSPQKKDLKRIDKLVEEINVIEARYQLDLNDEEIERKTAEFRDRYQNGETLEELLPEAFALVKFACRRLVGKSWKVRDEDYTWDMVPYDVQLVGGVIIHEGKIAEMKTGEGKTLACTMPVYLNAISGKGVHLVTVNEYLATRDAEWMGGLYRFLGLSVGVIKHGDNPTEKREAYEADITYGTNNEFGFDYLRDNMAQTKEHQVQRGLHYAIIDEVDSILIDEARTPLIISAPAEESTEKYTQYSKLVQGLQENTHYNIDEKQKVATLNEDGISQMETLLGVDNIYTEKGFEEVHHIEQALRAHAIYKKDIDYVIKDDQIMIVDEFTGRLMAGRRFGQGLHQAIEAKELVEIRRESKTLATITFQNYFRMFEKLAGMTGTAITEEEEFASIYGLNTVIIPTHRPIARNDRPDAIYKNISGKFKAIAEKTKELHDKGQPVLIGTISVEKSETLSALLKARGIPHNVLNAKHHEREAEIVANAGHKGGVTIATNMAGRGTDIKIKDDVKELGGLYVIGSERHESRRIDNQLRGRSGRQGDPGHTQFYVSMEDDLMRIFGGSRMQAAMEKLGLPDDMPIENRMISGSIESAQKKVEGRNFDVRKHLVKYDDVINTHREIIYKRRQEMLDQENLKNKALLLIDQEAEQIVLSHPEDLKEVYETVSAIHKDSSAPLALQTLEGLEQETLIKTIKDYLYEQYEEKEKSLPEESVMRKAERYIMLRVIDMNWMNHINALKGIREAVSLSGYGQRDPLIEYKNAAFLSFEEMIAQIDHNIVRSLFHVKINVQAPQPAPKQVTRTNEDTISQSITDGNKTSEDKIKIGRNDPCPCGSGKKYKKCHGKAD
ncbi:preprotein translocase subunit SecA [Candidatus Peregrinibacteria bacterium]|jgi:preprotein translocase subunit SecA|nr:preprotein translocase subunit SecA [Candidatus Peregrinibacteria bacterium]MBT4632034.1 preprotein translocase subunit SecA [Candidatus Peregrinibacteria bacterium]MBT5824414.1 preprotein translocase subunit SecA [Candidatus Peregrinibacteria bacterium]